MTERQKMESCSRPFSADLSLIRRLRFSLRREQRPRQRHIVGSSRAPLRVDVPLLDPCSGHLSAGSEAMLGLKNLKLSSDLRLPPALRDRARTAPSRTVGLSLDMSPDKDWNSRRVHPSALRAWVHAHPDADQPRQEIQAVRSVIPNKFEDRQAKTKEPVSPEAWVSEAIRHYTFTSATQRSYEEVNWDRKLPRRLKPPDSSLEKRADAVRDQHCTRRYYDQPQLWQSLGAEWDRQQLRVQDDVRKPISFCSGCPRSGQIPLYTGVIGSKNPQDIDNMDRAFTPLTLRRSLQPPYTPTARRTTIPGYTGRGVFADVSSLTPNSGFHGGVRRPSLGHQAPLSRMMTTTSPGNPFNSSSNKTRN